MATQKIISVSRRTDIPAFYSEWFYNRVEQGFVQVKKQVGAKTAKKILLGVKDVLCFVFWTKNPGPMLDKLHLLDENGYQYYFQFTLTPYDKNIESNLPKKKKIIQTFIKLSEKIGKKKVIWRYDPILLNHEIDLDYHKKYFAEFAEKLHGFTEKCIISFIDSHQISKDNKQRLKLAKINDETMKELGKIIYRTGEKYDMTIETCAEKIDLTQMGIPSAKCIDDRLTGKILGRKLSIGKDRSQRKLCKCVTSIDIGTDNTCLHQCLFCYATKNIANARFNNQKHNKNSPVLVEDI
ncbi:MAG: DUF1848 domain-containing protein [Deltaproteobacteria bacterium]|jgi:hypothetical protein|nr:DUF1848 domain-containing protein [Deltaproteobacteria bacterium]